MSPTYRRFSAALALAVALSGCTVAVQGNAGLTGAKAPAKATEKPATPAPSAAPSAGPGAATVPSGAPIGVAPSAGMPRGLLVPSRVLPALPGSLVKMMGDQTAGLVGNDGSTLIGLDGSTLVGNDGSTLVAAGGGNYRLQDASHTECPIFDRPLGDVVRLIRDDLALIAEVARIPEKAAKAAARFGMQERVATVFDPKAIAAEAAKDPGDDGSATMIANNPFLMPMTFVAEATADGGGGLYVYQAGEADPAKTVHGVRLTSGRKGEVYSHRAGASSSDAHFALSYDLDAGLAVADCYRFSKYLYPGRTRYRIELAKLPAPAADGTTFVFRASRRVRPASVGCPALNYSLLARFDAQGHGAVRLASIVDDEAAPSFFAPDGSRGGDGRADLAFYIGADGLAAAGPPDPAVAGMLGGMADMLPIPLLGDDDDPAKDAVFTPIQAETRPTGKRFVTLKEVRDVLESGVLFDMLTDQASAIDGGFGAPAAIK